jgi:hypothetical protein
VAEHDHRFRQALAVRGADVIRAHDLDHAVAGLAHQHGRQGAAEHEGGHEHALEVAQRVLEQRHEARGGQQVEPHREEEDEHDSQPEAGDGDAAQGHGVGQEIPDRIAAHGREDAGRDGDPDGDDQRETGELDRDRELHRHRLDHRLPRPDRLAQIAPERSPEPAEVLQGMGSFRPYFARISWSPVSSASVPAITRAGSPGIMRTPVKMIRVIRSRVSTEIATR